MICADFLAGADLQEDKSWSLWEPEEDEWLVEFHKGTTSKMWKKNPTKLSQNNPD
jgi:hypothetical protein